MNGRRDAEKVGWFCAYTPVELLSAAGMEPVRLFGASGPTPRADSVLGTGICPYVRACLEQGLAGGAPGAVVFAGCCDGMRRLYDAWERYCEPDFAHAFDLPRSDSPGSAALYRNSLAGLLDAVQAHTGREVSAPTLASAIRARAGAEGLLVEAADRMRGGPGFPADELLESFMAHQAGNGRTPGPGGKGAGGPRVAVTGNLVRPGGLLEAIDAAGARVVLLDLCSAERSVVWDEPLALEESSMDALLETVVRRYVEKVSCPRVLDTGERHDRMVADIRASGAAGLIAVPLMFCDPSLYDLPDLEDRMDREGIPVLVLASDYQDDSDGQVLTRLEAFLEMI